MSYMRVLEGKRSLYAYGGKDGVNISNRDGTVIVDYKDMLILSQRYVRSYPLRKRIMVRLLDMGVNHRPGWYSKAYWYVPKWFPDPVKVRLVRGKWPYQIRKSPEQNLLDAIAKAKAQHPTAYKPRHLQLVPPPKEPA